MQRTLFIACLLVVVTSATKTAFATSLTLSQILSDPTMQALSGESFGTSVAISGNYALVGAPGYDQSIGKVQLFDTTGTLLRTFDNPAPSASSDYFGWSVAMDGNNVLIGAPSTETSSGVAGRAFLFDASSGSLLRTFTNPYANSPSDLFGWSVALQGGNVLIGAPLDDSNSTDHGLVYLFDASTGVRLNSFYGPAGQISGRFGDSVDIDGNRVVIGHPLADGGTGRAYVYDISTVDQLGGVDTAQLLHTLSDTFGLPSDQFGGAIAIDGDMIVVGAERNDTQGNNVGRAFLFDAVGGALLRSLDDPTASGEDRFGWSVDIDGTRVIVGAWGDDTNGASVGQAYLFDAITGALLQSLDDPTITSADFFGQAVSINGDRVLVGAIGDDTQDTNVGQAYLFSPSSTTVPEPTGSALLGIGLAAMVALRQRRPRLARTNRGYQADNV